MKSFFEEYGFVMLSAIVVLILIGMAGPIGNTVKSQLNGVVDDFATRFGSTLPVETD